MRSTKRDDPLRDFLLTALLGLLLLFVWGLAQHRAEDYKQTQTGGRYE